MLNKISIILSLVTRAKQETNTINPSKISRQTTTLTDHEENELYNKFGDWFTGRSNNITTELTNKEIQYILDNMEHTLNNPDVPDTHLYRVGKGWHIEGLKEGDTITGSGLLRSFSQTSEATNEMINQGAWAFDDLVIYRTNGDVPFYTPPNYNNPYAYQEEVFVPLDTMKINKITTIPKEEFNNLATKSGIQNLELKSDTAKRWVEKVTIVDISYDDSVKSIHDPYGNTFSTTNLLQ